MRIFLYAILLAASPLAAAEVYKWVDETGRVHYGDKPPPGAQPASLPPVHTYSPGNLLDPESANAGTGTTQPPDPLSRLANCLRSKGVKYYSASWCPQCRKQSRMFGSAASSLPYVECSINGTREKTQACKSQGIEGYPTWIFANGQRVSGVHDPAALASLSGCT